MRRDFQDTYKSWRNNLVEELGGTYAPDEIIKYADWLYERADNIQAFSTLSSTVLQDPMQAAIVDAFSKRANKVIEDRLATYEDERYQQAVERMLQLQPEQRSIIHENIDINRMTPDKIERLNRVIDEAGAVRVVGTDEATPLATGSRGLQWGNPIQGRVQYTQDEQYGKPVAATNKAGFTNYSQPVDRNEYNLSFTEIQKLAEQQYGKFGGLESVGQTQDSFNRPVMRFQTRLSDKQKQAGETPRIIDFSYEQTTGNWFVGQADSSKQFVIRPSLGIQATANPALGSDDKYPNLEPGLRQGVGNVLEAIIAGKGSLGKPFKRNYKNDSPTAWTEEYGSLESVDIHQATVAQVADLGSRWSISQPDVGATEPEVLDKLVKILNDSMGTKNRYSVADYRRGYLQDNDTRLRFGRGYMLTSTNEPIDISTGSTKDFRRNFRGAAKGVGPATGVMFNDPAADNDGLFTSRIKASDRTFSRGQRINTGIVDVRAVFGEGEYLAQQGGLIQNRKTIPLWDYKGKNLEDLPVKSGQLFSRPGHQVGAIAEGLSYGGEYDKGGTLGGLSGFRAGSAVETLIENLQMQEYEVNGQKMNVPVMNVIQSSPITVGEYKPAPGFKGSGSPTNEHNPILRGLENTFGERPQVAIPVSSKRERLDSQALLAFESVAELETISKYMLQAARSIKQEDGSRKYEDDALSSLLQYTDREGNVVGSMMNADQEMLNNAFGAQYDPHAADIYLQAARMHMKDNLQKVPIQGARVNAEDMQAWQDALRERGARRFNAHWEKQLGKGWEDNLTGAEKEKYDAWREKAMQAEVNKTLRNVREIEQPGGHKMYSVDTHAYGYQGMILADMLGVNIGGSAKMSPDYFNALNQTQPDVAATLDRQLSGDVLKMTSAATMMTTFRANMFDKDGLTDASRSVRESIKSIDASLIDIEGEEARTRAELGEGATQAVIEKMTLERLSQKHRNNYVQMGNITMMPLATMNNQYEVDDLGSAPKNAATTGYAALKAYISNTKKMGTGDADDGTLWQEIQSTGEAYLQTLGERIQEVGTRKQATRFQFAAPGGPSSMIMGLPNEMKVLDDKSARKYIQRLAKDQAQQNDDEDVRKYEKEIWKKFQTEGLWGVSSMSSANREQMWQQSHFVSDSWLRGDKYHALEEKLAAATDEKQRKRIQNQMSKIEGQWAELGYNKDFFNQFRDVVVEEGTARSSASFIRGQNKDADGDPTGQHILTLLGKDQIYDPTHGDPVGAAGRAVGDEYGATVSKYGISMPEWLDEGIASGKPAKYLDQEKSAKSYAEGTLATRDMSSTFQPFVRDMFAGMLLGSRMAGVSQEQEEHIRGAADSGTAIYQWAMDKNLLQSAASETLMYGSKEMTLQSSKQGLYPTFHGAHYKSVYPEGNFQKGYAVSAEELMFDMLATHAMHRGGVDSDDDKAAWYGSEASGNKGLADVQATMLTRFKDAGDAETEARVKGVLNELFESGADAGLKRNEETGKYDFKGLNSDQRTKLLSAITGQVYDDAAAMKQGLQDYLWGSDMSGMSPASFWFSSEVMRNTAERAEQKNASSRYYGDIVENANRNNVGSLIGKFFGESGRYTVAKNTWNKIYGAAGDDIGSRKAIYEKQKQAYEAGQVKSEPLPYAKAPEAPVWPYIREGVQHFIKGSSGKLASIGNALLAANQVNYGAADPEQVLHTANKLQSSGLRGVFSGLAAPVQKAMGSKNPIMQDANTGKALATIMDETKAYLQNVGIVPRPQKRVAATEQPPAPSPEDINAMLMSAAYEDQDYDFMADGGTLNDEITFVGEAGMEAVVKQPDGSFRVLDANTTKNLFGNKTAAEMKGKMGGKYKADGGNLDDDEEVDPFHFDPSINYWSGYDTGMSREAFYLTQFTGINPEWIPKKEGKKLLAKDDVERYMARREEKDPKNAKYSAGLEKYHSLIGQMPRKAVVGKRQEKWLKAQEQNEVEAGGTASMPRNTTFKVGSHEVTRNMSEEELEALTGYFKNIVKGSGGLNVEMKPFSASELEQGLADYGAYLDLNTQRARVKYETGQDLMDDTAFAKRFVAANQKVSGIAGRATFMRERLGLSYDQMTNSTEQGKLLSRMMEGISLDELESRGDLHPAMLASLESEFGGRESRQLPALEKFFNPAQRRDVARASSTVALEQNNQAIAGAFNQQGEGVKNFQRQLIEAYTATGESGTSPLDRVKQNLFDTVQDLAQGKPTEMQSSDLFEAKKLLDAAKNVGKDEVVGFNVPELEELVSSAETFGLSAKRPDFDPEKLGKAKAAKQLLQERFSGGDIRNAVAAVQGGAGDADMLGRMEEAYKLIQTAKAGGLELGDEFGHETQQALAYGVEYGKAQDYKPQAKLDQQEAAVPGLKGAMTALQDYQGVLQSMGDTLPELTSEQKRNVTVMQSALRVHEDYSKVMKSIEGDTSDAAEGIREAFKPFSAMMEDIGKNKANFEGQIEQYRTQQGMMKGTAQDKEMQEAELTALLQKRGFTGKRARDDDRYEELARQGIDTAFGKLGGAKGTMGREALEAYGGAMRGISTLQGAMFSTMMARNQLIQPMTDLADKYQKQAINRDMAVLGAGFGSYDSMMDSEYGSIKRRSANRELATGAMGQEIYRMYGGAINMGANQSIAAGAGAAFGGIAPALAAGMIGKSLFSPGYGLAIGAATYGASQIASGMSVHNNENAIADKFFRSQAALRDGGIGAQIGDALWSTVTDFGGQIGAMTSSQEERDRAMAIARERLDARDFFRGGTGNIRNYFQQNATDANMTRGLSLQFQTEAADQFGMGTQEANEALQYQLIYGGNLPTQAGNPMYATGQMARWGTYGININEMARNVAQSQGTLSSNAAGVGGAWGSLDQYLTEISDPNNRYGTSIGEEGIRIQNSMQRTGQMNSMLAQAGLETLDWDYYTSRGGGRRRRDDMYGQDTEMRIMQTRANTALYNDQFADRTGEYYQDLATGYLNGGDLRGANRISQQYQQAGGFFQQYAMMMGADNTGDAARQLASLSQLESDQFDLASGVLSGNPYAASAAYQQARARGETTGLGSGMYNLVDLQTGLNPYQQNIDASEAATLRQFDYGGWLEGRELEGLSPIKMQREMAQMQYAQQDRQYATGRQMEFANFAAMTGGEMTLQTTSNPTEEMQGFIDQLEPAAKGLELVAETFKEFGFEFNRGDGRGYRQLEDDQLGIQRGRERRSWEMQEQSLGMSEEGMQLRWSQFFENLGFSKEKFGYQTEQQRGDMALDRGMQLQQRQWRMEDMSFQRSKAEIGFGWQMEDFDLNLRYARGRQRRDLMRQQERTVISHSMDMAKMDRDEDRQETTNKFDDTKFARAVANFNKLTDFQNRAFEMQEKHFREQFELDQRQHEMNKQKFQEDKAAQEQLWAIEDQRRLLDRQFQEAQFAVTQKLSEEAHNTQVALREMSDTLRGIAEAYGNQQAKFQASRQTLEALSDVYASLGGQYTDFTQQVGNNTAAMGQQLSTNVTSMVQTVSTGATSIFNAIAGIFTQLSSLSAASSSSSNSSSFDDMTYSEQFAQQYGQPGSGGGGGGGFTPYAEGGYVGALTDLQQNAPGVIGYAKGGYTGSGGKYESAGIGSIEVHKGEYIVPQSGAPVVRGDNPATLEELRRIRTAIEKLVSMGIYNINAVINTRDGSVRGGDVSSIKDEVYRN